MMGAGSIRSLVVNEAGEQGSQCHQSMTPTEAVSGGKGPTDSLARSLTEVSDLAVGGTDRDPAHG